MQPTLSVPDSDSTERPILRANVRLVGQMRDTGFEHPQWLVQRGGEFLQVTELLYRILEQIDGRNTFDNIAERVTASSQWEITADQVEQLISRKLQPLGLAGTVEEPQGNRHASTVPRSPLAVYMRMRTIGPKVIDPIARLFEFLFRWPVLAIMLASIAAAHFWLYRVHGLSKSVDATLST